MFLYLVRHPRPTLIDGLCYGRLDVAVAPTEVHNTVEAIGNLIPRELLHAELIYSSPAQRCKMLASQLAKATELLVSDDLAEMHFGHWEGQQWDVIPRIELDAWSTDLWNYRPGGGESANMVLLRWQRFCNTLNASNSETVIAVTHAGVIRLAYANAGRVNPEDIWTVPVEFGSVHLFEF
jgi:alpha-ribazole phosphatase